MVEPEYDVALSYDGTHREYVARVGRALEDQGVRVFLDVLDPARQWGHDLAVFFDEVFRRQARFAVVFVSEEYVERTFTTLEFRSALARAITEREPYLLPVRFDDVELPGLRPTIGFLDARKMTAEEIAEAVLSKLGKGRTGASTAAVKVAARLPKVTPVDFNPYAAAEDMAAHLTDQLTARAHDLRQLGYSIDARERNGRFKLRIMRSGGGHLRAGRVDRRHHGRQHDLLRGRYADP